MGKYPICKIEEINSWILYYGVYTKKNFNFVYYKTNNF